MRNRLLIATTSAGKVRELRECLAPFENIELAGLSDFSDLAEVAETGSTFRENAELKATGYARQTNCYVLADDSGLEVAALGGAPGVHSARYAGEGAGDAERIAKLLGELAGQTHRSARFVCVLSCADPRGRIVNTWTGTCEGEIALAVAGSNGFGYDPVFIPAGYDRTFGELPPAIKNRLSHRARALKQALPNLQNIFQSTT